jgi:hypothetical protein
MPSRVMSILSVMGFSCERQKGIDMLDRAFSKRNSLPHVFAGYAIMFYNLYVEQILGTCSHSLCKCPRTLLTFRPFPCRTRRRKHRMGEGRVAIHQQPLPERKQSSSRNCVKI